MRLAEALLRIPDRATADSLIRDKLARGDWRGHLGHSDSLFVNAATWGLLLTGKLVSTHSEMGMTAAIGRIDKAKSLIQKLALGSGSASSVVAEINMAVTDVKEAARAGRN